MTVHENSEDATDREVTRVSIRWHQSTDNDQTVLALEGGDVNLAVAFREDVPPREIERVLDEYQRELRYYLGTDGGRTRR